MNDKVTENLAVNTGNMIASLNLQLAKQQVAYEALENDNQTLKAENDKLKLELDALRKKVKVNEPNTNYSNNKQNSK